MLLSTTSLHACIYRTVYGLDKSDYMPDSLCTYFWKCVGAWLAFIPMCVLSILGYIVIAIFNLFGAKMIYRLPVACMFTIVTIIGTLIATFLLEPLWYVLAGFHDVYWHHIFIGKDMAYLTGTIDILILSFIFWSKVISIGMKNFDNMLNMTRKYITSRIKGFCPHIFWNNNGSHILGFRIVNGKNIYDLTDIPPCFNQNEILSEELVDNWLFDSNNWSPNMLWRRIYVYGRDVPNPTYLTLHAYRKRTKNKK